MNEDLNKTEPVDALEKVTENVVVEKPAEKPAEEPTEKPTENSTKSNYTMPKTKNNRMSIISILIIILLVIIVVAVLVYMSMLKPEKIVKNSINAAFENLILTDNEASMELINDLLTNEKFLDYNLEIGTNFDELKSLLLNISGNVNLPAAKAFFNYSLLNNDYTLLDGSLNIDGKTIYVKEENITNDSYIHTKTDNIILDKEIFKTESYTKEYNDVVNVIKEVLLNNIPEDSLTQADEILKIEDKEIKTKKTTFTISEELALKITKEIITNLKTNESFIKIATSSNMPKTELSKQLDTILKDLNKVNPTKNKMLAFDFYNKGLKIIKYGVHIFDVENDELVLTTDMLIYDTEEFDYQISLTDNVDTYYVNVRQLTEDSYKIDFIRDNATLLTANFEYTDKNVKLKITSSIFTATIESTDKDDYADFKIDLNLADLYEISLKTDLTIDDSKSTIKANFGEISASKDGKKLTESETRLMLINFINVLDNAPIAPLIAPQLQEIYINILNSY